MTASPIRIVTNLWGGELPEFDSMDAANELIGLLINGLWNSLTRHQKRSEPFRLVRTPIASSRAALAAHALMRCQEIDGFVEGLFNGQESIDLPEMASASLNVLGEVRAMLAGVHTLAADETSVASDNEIGTTLKRVRELTPIMEHEIHAVVLVCSRIRRQMLQPHDLSGSTSH